MKSGLIEEIKVDDVDAKSGGAMQKTVSRPKQEDNTKYLKSLTEE